MLDSNEKWTSKTIERESPSTRSVRFSVEQEENKECAGILKKVKQEPMKDYLLALCETIVKLARANRIIELFKDTNNKQLIENLSINDMKDLMKECNLIPIICNHLFVDFKDKLQAYPYKDRIRVYFHKEYMFTTIFSIWKRPLHTLIKLAVTLSSDISNKINAHYKMLGVIAGLSYVYTTYTIGSIPEKVIGIAVGGYGSECKMSGIQIAKLIDAVAKRFGDLDLPGEVMVEKYKENREGYLDRVVDFYAGVYSSLPAKIAGEIFGYLFTPPQKEINNKDEILFYMGMEAFFMKKLFSQLGYSFKNIFEFLEEWDKDKHWINFLRRTGKLKQYEINY